MESEKNYLDSSFSLYNLCLPQHCLMSVCLFALLPQAIGIMGSVLEEANPQIRSSVLKCVSQAPSPDVQKAAIQALRKMTVTDEVS